MAPPLPKPEQSWSEVNFASDQDFFCTAESLDFSCLARDACKQVQSKYNQYPFFCLTKADDADIVSTTPRKERRPRHEAYCYDAHDDDVHASHVHALLCSGDGLSERITAPALAGRDTSAIWEVSPRDFPIFYARRLPHERNQPPSSPDQPGKQANAFGLSD